MRIPCFIRTKVPGCFLSVSNCITLHLESPLPEDSWKNQDVNLYQLAKAGSKSRWHLGSMEWEIEKRWWAEQVTLVQGTKPCAFALDFFLGHSGIKDHVNIRFSGFILSCLYPLGLQKYSRWIKDSLRLRGWITVMRQTSWFNLCFQQSMELHQNGQN